MSRSTQVPNPPTHPPTHLFNIYSFTHPPTHPPTSITDLRQRLSQHELRFAGQYLDLVVSGWVGGWVGG